MRFDHDNNQNVVGRSVFLQKKKKSGIDLENANLMLFNILLKETVSVNNLSGEHI